MPTVSRRFEGLVIALKRNKLSRQKMGITHRVMLYLILFVAFVIMLLWLFQIVFLDQFYCWDKTMQIRSASDTVAHNMDNEQLDDLIDRIAANGDMCILLLSADGKVIHASEDIRFCLIHRMSSRDLNWWCSIAPEDGSVITQLFNIRPGPHDHFDFRKVKGDFPYSMEIMDKQSLLCARRVKFVDGTHGFLLLNAIITPLTSTVSTLRSQLLLITFVVLTGAFVLAAIISRKVTRPIIETNEAARSLSHGQYTPPCHGSSYREMAELNQTLVLAAQELSQVEHLQHELIANISHDLRTPLTMIGGYAEVMRDIPGESTPENMQIIIDETTRLTTLVNEIMDFSRLQSGSTTIDVRSFLLTEGLQGIVARVSKLVEKDGYIVRFIQDQSVCVRADEKRIEQVVYNLLGNALTYTGEDKTVTLTQEVHDQTVRISIHDSGKGIPPEEIPLIWKRYYRTQETHRRAIIGSGLGLSIVQSILEKHGFAYGIESELGSGTTFWFELMIDSDAT